MGFLCRQVGIEMPLETASSKLKQKELDGILIKQVLFATIWGKIKKYMMKRITAKKPDKPVKKIVTDKLVKYLSARLCFLTSRFHGSI